MSVDNKIKRRNYFIKKEFQRNFILKFCTLVTLSALMSGGILYFFLRNTATTAFVNSRLTIVRTSDYILPSLVSSSIISVILVGLATIAVVMFLSHRITGALFHIERCVVEATEGNLACRIRLRSTDEIVALADSFNRMFESIEEKANKSKECIKEIQKEIENIQQISQSANSSTKKQLQDAVQKLTTKKQELDNIIAQFQTCIKQQ